MDGSELAAHLEGWAPGPVEVTGRLDAWPVLAFAGLLDQPAPPHAPGDPLPPLWHGFHLLDHPAQAELGEDGHPGGWKPAEPAGRVSGAHGRFLPPLPDRRRMFAGGRLEVRDPLRVDEVVTRRSALLAATPKSGRSGAMVFVTVRHEFLRDGEVVVAEEQDFAYRSQRAGQARGPVATPPGPAEASPGKWHLRLETDPALLFRFSALTYNTHRIHYDHPYVTGVEGYPGLVVHGPLLALLLLELPRRFAPERRVTSFSYRLLRPAFAGTPVMADGDGPGELTAGVPGGPPSVAGTVTLN